MKRRRPVAIAPPGQCLLTHPKASLMLSVSPDEDAMVELR